MTNNSSGCNTSGNLFQTSLTTNGVVYSAASGVLASTASTNNGALITSNAGVPSILAESATAGIPLVSGGTGVPPLWSTAVVAGGGTGAVTLTGLALGSGTSAFTGVTYTAKTSFTPVLHFGGLNVGITYGTQNGTYQQIGNVVFFQIFIILTSKGSSTGNATLTGWPVNSSDYVRFTVAPDTITLTATNIGMVVELQSGGTTVILYQYTITGNDSVALTDTNFNNTSRINFSGHYFT